THERPVPALFTQGGSANRSEAQPRNLCDPRGRRKARARRPVLQTSPVSQAALLRRVRASGFARPYGESTKWTEYRIDRSLEDGAAPSALAQSRGERICTFLYGGQPSWPESRKVRSLENGRGFLDRVGARGFDQTCTESTKWTEYRFGR